MPRRTAQRLADFFTFSTLLTTMAAAIFALLGLVPLDHFEYFAPVGLLLGTVSVFSMICNLISWKIASFYGVVFAAIGVAYFYSGVYPNLHADTAWIFLSGSAIIVAHAWNYFQFDQEKQDDRPAYAAATLTLLVLLAPPLIWGTGKLEFILVLAWTGFSTYWVLSQLSASYRRAISAATLTWSSLPLVAVVVTYTIDGKWWAAFAPLVVYVIANDQIDAKLNPQVAGRGVLA